MKTRFFSLFTTCLVLVLGCVLGHPSMCAGAPPYMPPPGYKLNTYEVATKIVRKGLYTEIIVTNVMNRTLDAKIVMKNARGGLQANGYTLEPQKPLTLSYVIAEGYAPSFDIYYRPK